MKKYYYKVEFSDGSTVLSKDYGTATECFKDLPFDLVHYEDELGCKIEDEVENYLCLLDEEAEGFVVYEITHLFRPMLNYCHASIKERLSQVDHVESITVHRKEIWG